MTDDTLPEPEKPPENILTFRVRDDKEPRVVLKAKNYDGCQHVKYTLVVDTELRSVECSSCKEPLDPIWCLEQWARLFRKIDYEYFEIKKELALLRHLKRKIEKHPERMRMTEREKGMDFNELRAHHSDKGCPKERMWFDRGMIRCYCGVGLNAESYPKLAEEVREAHEAVKARNAMRVSS